MATQTPLLDSVEGSKQSSLAGVLATALSRFAIDDENLIPARVVEYNRTQNVVTVQPQIMWVGMDNKNRSRHQIANIPCISLGGGGFHVNFPIKDGDLGWVFAGDRDMALFMQSLAESPPNTYRVHRFADGLFIPDVMRKYTIAAEDATAMVIQSTDNSTKISLSPGNIIIQAPTKVLVRTPQSEFTGNVQIDGNLVVEGTTELEQTLEVTGETTVNGGFDATGGGGTQICNLPSTTRVDNKLVDGHDHGGVQSGPSNTDPF